VELKLKPTPMIEHYEIENQHQIKKPTFIWLGLAFFELKSVHP
jgi:hypothetical protein